MKRGRRGTLINRVLTLDCPCCRQSLELDVAVGAQQQKCPVCSKTFWVSVSAPTVSTRPLTHVGNTHETVNDLGPGVQTVVGRAPSLATPPRAGSKPRHDAVTLAPRPNGKPPPRRPTREHRARSAPHAFVEPKQQAAPGMALGGLQLLARIGGGGMGTVWLARQVSLDRNVAVKILRPNLGADPSFVIQFTREALAAAQLVHHNIVQIHDIGLEHELHYFSMEYVEGESLSALLKREGRLDPEVAAGYVLQAARGLKFAHERGLIHRDIKPENLLLNRDGIVKVADLGLVKRLDERDTRAVPSSTVANLGFGSSDVIVGTPAYMAPEQVLDAGAVDERADIYSLGCTFYDLLTGRPPFEADTSTQLLTLHVTAEPVPPNERNHRVPAELSALVLEMMAKKPEARLQSMGVVVKALERSLGIDGSTLFSPREEHAALLERSVAGFNTAPWALRRTVARVAFIACSTAAVVGAAVLGFRAFAAWAAFFIGTVTLTSFIINSLMERSPLLLKLRHLVLGAPLWAWSAGFGALGVLLSGLWWEGLLLSAAENLGLAIAVGLSSFLLVDRKVARQRRPLVQAVEALLKSMRLKGLEEQRLRQFICRYSGLQWEPFYEALFGYDAKLDARARWGKDDKGVPRKRHGAWRDPLIRFIERRLERRQARHEAAQLERLDGAAD